MNPIRYRGTLLEVITCILVLIALAFAAPAVAQEQPPPQPVGSDYGAMLNTALQMQFLRTQLELLKAQAQAGSIESCSKFQSELAQVMCAGFATGWGNATAQGAGAGQQQAAITLPGPPPPKIESGNWLNAIINAPAALLDFAKAVAPMGFQYLLGRVNARSNEAIQISNAETQRAIFNTVGGMHAASVGALQGTAQSGFTAAQQIATQGYITIGGMPPAQQWTFTNSHGINTGAGSLSFNPVTSSYNNPNARVCSWDGAAFACN